MKYSPVETFGSVTPRARFARAHALFKSILLRTTTAPDRFISRRFRTSSGADSHRGWRPRSVRLEELNGVERGELNK